MGKSCGPCRPHLSSTSGTVGDNMFNNFIYSMRNYALRGITGPILRSAGGVDVGYSDGFCRV
jgi:hypothetical protein